MCSINDMIGMVEGGGGEVQLCGDGGGMLWRRVWVVCMSCRCHWY